MGKNKKIKILPEVFPTRPTPEIKPLYSPEEPVIRPEENPVTNPPEQPVENPPPDLPGGNGKKFLAEN